MKSVIFNTTVNKSLLLAFLLLTTDILAAPQSSISIEGGADDNTGHNYYLSGRYAFDNGFRIKASTGESISRDSSNIEVSSTSRSFGLQSDPTELVNVSVYFSNSDQTSTLEIDTTKFNIELNTYDWNIYLSPGFRQISALTTSNTTIDLESDERTIGLGYYGFYPLYLSLSHLTYDYSQQLTAIANNINFFIQRFGTDTLNQVFALEDKRTTFEIGYYLDNVSIALNRSKGRSAVDKSISTAHTIFFDYKLSNQWSVGLCGGSSQVDISDYSTKFATISLSYRW